MRTRVSWALRSRSGARLAEGKGPRGLRGLRPGPGLPEQGGAAPCRPEGARGAGGRPGPGHSDVRGRAGPRSWTPACSPGACAAQGGHTRVVRRGPRAPGPAGEVPLLPALGWRAALSRAGRQQVLPRPGRSQETQVLGGAWAGEAPPTHGPHSRPGPPCGGQVLPQWPLAPLGLLLCSGRRPGVGQSGQPAALALSLVGGPARTPAQSPSACTCRTGTHAPGPPPRSSAGDGGHGEP